MSSKDINGLNNYENGNQITNSINAEKTGKFIRELRRAHNLTQNEFGEKLFVTRKAVSKWETGHACPSIDTIKMMCDIYGVNIDEVLAGEFSSDSMYLEKNKKLLRRILRNKNTKLVSIITIILVFLALIIFYVENYNSTSVYTMYYGDENFEIANGTIVFSKSKKYINMGTISNYLNDIKENTKFHYTFYIKTTNGQEKVLLTYQSDKHSYFNKNGYNEIDTNNLKENLDNLYFKIRYININGNEKQYDLHLIVELDYKSNDKFDIKENVFNDLLLESNNIIEGEKSETSETLNYETISLEFLYKKDTKELKTLYHNKNIFVDNEKFTISTNKENSLDLESISKTVIFNLDENKLYLIDVTSNEEVEIYFIKDKKLKINTNDKYYELIKNIVFNINLI